MGFISDIGGLLGKNETKTSSGEQQGAQVTTGGSTGRQIEQLDLDAAGFEKIVRDVLGGANGLADIFSAEKNAGIFNSSVGANAAGDLAVRVAGELAKLTAKKLTFQDNENTETTLENIFSSSVERTNADSAITNFFSGIFDTIKTGEGGLRADKTFNSFADRKDENDKRNSSSQGAVTNPNAPFNSGNTIINANNAR